jgi:hypothetical protein
MRAQHQAVGERRAGDHGDRHPAGRGAEQARGDPDGGADEQDPRGQRERAGTRPAYRRSRADRPGALPVDPPAPPAPDARAGSAEQDPLVAVTDDVAEPVGSGLPVLARLRDLLVAAGGEVPPHHEVLLERLAAEEEEQRPALARHGDALAGVAEEQHVVRGERGLGQSDPETRASPSTSSRPCSQAGSNGSTTVCRARGGSPHPRSACRPSRGSRRPHRSPSPR